MLFGEKRAENVRQLLSSQERIPNIYTHAHANTHTNTVGRASVEYVRESFFGGGGGVYVKAAVLGVLVFKSKTGKLVWIWPTQEV